MGKYSYSLDQKTRFDLSSAKLSSLSIEKVGEANSNRNESLVILRGRLESKVTDLPGTLLINLEPVLRNKQGEFQKTMTIPVAGAMISFSFVDPLGNIEKADVRVSLKLVRPFRIKTIEQGVGLGVSSLVARNGYSIGPTLHLHLDGLYRSLFVVGLSAQGSLFRTKSQGKFFSFSLTPELGIAFQNFSLLGQLGATEDVLSQSAAGFTCGGQVRYFFQKNFQLQAAYQNVQGGYGSNRFLLGVNYVF